MSSGKDYKVTIKSANQKTDDYVATCKSEWTVYKLKSHIAITHVNKPPVEDQRLIYAGRLLNDNHILRQVFFRDSLCTDQNPDKVDFTIHLVCAQRQISNVAVTSQSNNTRPSEAPASAQDTRSPGQLLPSFVQNQNLANQQPNTSLNHLARSSPHHQQQQSNQNSSVSPASTASNTTESSVDSPNSPRITYTSNISSGLARLTISSGSSSDPRVTNNPYINHVNTGRNFTLDPHAQQALFQQMAQLVASQIHRLSVGGVGSTGTVPIGVSPPPNLMPSGTYTISSFSPHYLVGARLNANPFQHNLVRDGTNPQPDMNNNLNNNEGQNAAGEQFRNVVPNIEQVRPIQQDENLDAQRNVIDWLYYTFRALLFMTAIYMNSSYKFLLVVCLLAFCYFYKRSLANRRQQQRQMEEAQRLVEIRNYHHQDQGANNIIGEHNELRNRARPSASATNDNRAVPENEQSNNIQAEQEARLPFFRMIYMVVSSFVISLIPDAENHI